jgi:D-alanyl-D-alanine carboxypeptidase/D-alanyl-D-alanine-endopeptidase (penicillin-binding protein 4)
MNTSDIENTVPAVYSVPAQPAAEERQFALEGLINTVIQDESLNGSVTGISIRSGNTGKILYSSMGDIRLHPASNMKLLTAAAALRTLGPEYKFSTELWKNK